MATKDSMLMETEIDIDGLDVAEGQGFDDEEVEWLDLDESGDLVAGELIQVRDNAGEFDSRLYKIESPDYDLPVCVWGNRSINGKVDRNGVSEGDTVLFRNTGESYKTKNGKGVEFEVRYKKD